MRRRPGVLRYDYRFLRLVAQMADRRARAIGEAILDDWRAFPRDGDFVDDVTVLVATAAA